MRDANETGREFRRELKALLAKYHAELSCEEGDIQAEWESVYEGPGTQGEQLQDYGCITLGRVVCEYTIRD